MHRRRLSAWKDVESMQGNDLGSPTTGAIQGSHELQRSISQILTCICTSTNWQQTKTDGMNIWIPIGMQVEPGNGVHAAQLRPASQPTSSCPCKSPRRLVLAVAIQLSGSCLSNLLGLVRCPSLEVMFSLSSPVEPVLCYLFFCCYNQTCGWFRILFALPANILPMAPGTTFLLENTHGVPIP